MSIPYVETKALSRHFLAACAERNIDTEEAIVELLNIKTYQAIRNWTVGAVKMSNPTVMIIRAHLRDWGRPEDPSGTVNAYFTMAQELSVSQQWELVTLLLDALETHCRGAATHD